MREQMLDRPLDRKHYPDHARVVLTLPWLFRIAMVEVVIKDRRTILVPESQPWLKVELHAAEPRLVLAPTAPPRPIPDPIQTVDKLLQYKTMLSSPAHPAE